MTARDGSMTDMKNSLTTAGTQKPLPKIAAWVIALTAAGVSVATGGLWLILVLWYILIPVAVGVSLVYGVYRLIIRGKEGWLRNPFAWPDLLTPVATMLVWFLPECIAPVRSGKSLSNAVLEPLILGGLFCAAWIVRLGCYSRVTFDKSRVAWVMLCIMCALSLAVFALVPGLLE